MKKIKYLLSFLAFCFGLGLSLSVSDVMAEDVITSLTVTPQHQSIMLTPGETYHGSIKVSSQSASTRATGYEISVGPFSDAKGENSLDDYGEINYIDKSNYNMIVDWIEIENPTGSVEPNESVTIPFTIKVPKDVPAGGQYASIIVKDSTPPVQQDDGVAVDSVMQILSILYTEVAGETRDEGEIITNSMPSFLLNGPLTMESMVHNKGNVHTLAEYTMQVWPLFSSEEICTNEEKPDTSLVMPETERYHTQTCDLPSVGIFRAKQVVKIFGENSVVERTIIICPLWLLFLIVFALIAFVIWMIMKIRGSKKRRKSSSSDDD